MLLFSAVAYAENGETYFSKETFRSGTTTLPYRRAMINGDQTGTTKPALVIYLHGGSSKGSDNEKQIQEPAVTAIADYLSSSGTPALFIVPECPQSGSWIGQMLTVVKSLLQTYIDNNSADADRIYILGGSMGGTGTWNMLSLYPGFFAAAMPCAGNPSLCNAENVAKTPLFTVMGTADNIMSIPTVEDFLSEMDTFGAEYMFETEEGWTHENTCKQSYTATRLDWVFSHVRDNGTGISNISADKSISRDNRWFSIDGRIIPKPNAKGIYIKNGKKIVL